MQTLCHDAVDALLGDCIASDVKASNKEPGNVILRPGTAYIEEVNPQKELLAMTFEQVNPPTVKAWPLQDWYQDLFTQSDRDQD